MGECLDKKIGDMLYEYELGLLGEDEADLVEAHLLACSYCRELALEHDQVAELLRGHGEIRELIDELGSASPVESRSETKSAEVGARKRRWPYWLRPIAAAALLATVLILKPWNLQFQPSDEAVALDRVLAIMPLDNLTEVSDSSKLALITTNLLTADLSESRFLRVVSNRTINDLRAAYSTKRSDSANRDEIAWQVARATQATWILTGSLAELDSGLVLTSRVTEVATGEVVLSHTVRTEHKGDVFSLVDQLAARIRNDLLVPLGDEEVFDPAVTDVTTSSATAYRFYLEGLEYYNEMLLDDASRCWRRALEYDSTFAMCYFYLSRESDQNLIAKAVEYSEKASRRERLHILSLEARYAGDRTRAQRLLEEVVDQYPQDVLAWTTLAEMSLGDGQLDRGAEYLERALQIDPANKTAYATLAYTYRDLGEIDKAMLTVDAYIELAPHEANPLDTKGDILASIGKLDEAIDLYERVRSQEPDFAGYTTMLELGQLYKYKGEYEKAQACFQVAATYGDSHARSTARTEMALLPMYQGKLTEAWSVLADGMAADRLDQATARFHGPGQKNYFVAGLAHLALGEYSLAAEELQKTIEIRQATFPDDSVGYRALYAFALAGSGDYPKAQTIIEHLKQHIMDSYRGHDSYWIGSGLVNFARGDYQSALHDLEQVSSIVIRSTFSYRFWLGRALLENQRYLEASEVFSTTLANYASEYRSLMAIWGVQTHYFLAQACELGGQTDAAIQEYETFVGIWKEAEPPLQDMVRAARERLSLLKDTP